MRLPPILRLPLALCLLPLPALADAPVVVTDIPPVHALVSMVMGDLGAPVLLLAPGADEHDFQLRPSQMQSLADADLIIWISPDLTPWLDRATQTTTAPMLTLLTAPETRAQDYPVSRTTTADVAEPDLSGTDPHVWLNPDNAWNWLPLIAANLAQADPANAAAYAANAAAAQTAIAALQAELTASLAPIIAKPFVTYHNAYGYFASHFALNYAGALADGEAAEPGAGHLVALQAQLTAENIGCVFPEAQHDPVLAAQLLDGTPAKLGGALDPVGSTLEPGPDAYATLLRGLAATLIACLHG